MELKAGNFSRLAGEFGAYAHGMRSLGSAALNYATVASGQLDLYQEIGCWSWVSAIAGPLPDYLPPSPPTSRIDALLLTPSVAVCVGRLRRHDHRARGGLQGVRPRRRRVPSRRLDRQAVSRNEARSVTKGHPS